MLSRPVVLSTAREPAARAALRLAWLAAVLGVAYAAVSAYWAVGGTGLLDTVGGSIGRAGRAGGAGITLALWAVAVLKLVAAALPLRAIGDRRGSRAPRTLRRLAWLEAGIFILYGLVQTGAGLVVQTGVVAPPAHPDWRALDWHAFVWDPWFLGWGLAVAAALRCARRTPRTPRTPRTRRRPRTALR